MVLLELVVLSNDDLGSNDLQPFVVVLLQCAHCAVCRHVYARAAVVGEESGGVGEEGYAGGESICAWVGSCMSRWVIV